MFKIYGDRAELWQWDLNQKIIVENDTISEVHFCDGIGNCSLVSEVYDFDGLRVANIPNIILQDNCDINIFTYHNINIFAFVKDQDGSYTKHKEIIKVNKRSKPADYVYTETEVKSYETLMEKLDEIELGLIDKIDNEYDVKLQEKIEVINEIINNNAAEKIEAINEVINNNVAEKIEEYNNNADNLISIAADTRNELERIKNDVLETGEASGNYLHLEDSTMAELQELEVNSVEKQFTTTGKNLIDINEVKVPISSYKLPHTLSAGTYTISCKNVNLEMGFRLSNTTDTSTNSVVKTGINVIGNRQYLTLTTTFEANYINLSCTGIEKLEEIMLELGDVPTEYEPYTGLKTSPSPDYPQKIPMITTDSVLKSVGKNLFNKDITPINYYYDNTGAYVSINTNTYIHQKIKATSKKYIISYKNKYQKLNGSDITAYVRFVEFKKDGTYISRPMVGSNGNIITLNDETSYFILCVDNGKNAYFEDLQVEAGTNITEYEPYQESILNMPIPEGEFVGYINDNAKDKLRVGYNEEDGNYHLYLDKMLGKVILNGSENWGKSGSSTDKYFVGALANANLTNVFKTNKNTILISHFNRSGITSSEECFSFYNANSEGIFQAFALSLSIDKVTTLEEFKAWIAANKPEVVYALANPYTLDLGVVDMPLSYDGTTNIFVDTDLLMNINATYYRNFTETVRNLQINNDTLKNELTSIESRLSALEVAKASVVSESEVIE